MNVEHWIRNIIGAHERCTVPLMTHPGLELVGATVAEAVRDGEVHARAICELSRKYPSAAATVMMDLTVEAEAFGCSIAFPENDMPHILNRLVDAAHVESLAVPPLSAGRIPQYLQATASAAERLGEKPLFAGAIGPFSLAGRLYGMSEIMVDCYLEPEAVEMLLNKCADFVESYCRALKQTGCAGVVIAEPAAGLLSNDDCMRFSSAYVRRIVESVQDDTFMVILHNCGNTGQCTAAMVATGAKAYHFGNAASMTEALEQCPQDALVMGNVDPVGVLRLMPPEGVEKAVTQLLEQTAAYPNFVLSTGCDVPPGVPEANIQAYYAALAAYNGRL